MPLVNIGSVENFPVNRGMRVEVDGRHYAVFNTTGQYYAVDDRCPHEGGALSEGELKGARVTCPLHGTVADVRTGDCSRPCTRDVETYDVSCDSQDLFLHVD